MKFLFLVVILCSLSSCAGLTGWWAEQPEEVKTDAADTLGHILSGNTTGAIGTGIDLVLYYLGYRGLLAGTRKAKQCLVNPKPPEAE